MVKFRASERLVDQLSEEKLTSYRAWLQYEQIEDQDYLTKIKPFGKKIMNVKDYLNGVKKETILNWVINE